MDEVTDAPIDASAFMRHFTVPYEEIKLLNTPNDPYLGYYKTTSDHNLYPIIKSKNPIEPDLNPIDARLFNIMNNYEDLFYLCRSPDNETIRIMYCAHALNHSLRCRKLVIKNNEKEKQYGISDDLRDQSFHRARTLILAPTKEAARRIVHTILRLMPKGSTVSHRRRFEQDFGPQPGETDEEKKRGKKPKDFEDWFGGNMNDHFRIGLAFGRKTVKLYSAFGDSDLILASPLGLQTIMDEEKEKEVDVQYIMASIELLIIDQAEMLLMQNWKTVQNILSKLNQRPTKSVFASSGRIRHSYLAGYGRRYRQTMLFSAISNFHITLVAGECDNFQGVNYIPPRPIYPSLYLSDLHRLPGLKSNMKKIGQKRVYTDEEDRKPDHLSRMSNAIKLNLISFVVPGQITSKNLGLEGSSADDDDDVGDGDLKEQLDPAMLVSCRKLAQVDFTYLGRSIPMARLNAFKQRILPRLRRGTDLGVLMYIPDFYDVEEVRRTLQSESLEFCCIHEYTDDSEAERFRTLFADGRMRILVISERYYFFRRRRIRGAQNYIFYGPPNFPWFVKELLNYNRAQFESTENKSNMTFLYYPPLESHTISMITGCIDV